MRRNYLRSVCWPDAGKRRAVVAFESVTTVSQAEMHLQIAQEDRTRLNGRRVLTVDELVRRRAKSSMHDSRSRTAACRSCDHT